MARFAHGRESRPISRSNCAIERVAFLYAELHEPSCSLGWCEAQYKWLNRNLSSLPREELLSSAKDFRLVGALQKQQNFLDVSHLN